MFCVKEAPNRCSPHNILTIDMLLYTFLVHQTKAQQSQRLQISLSTRLARLIRQAYLHNLAGNQKHEFVVGFLPEVYHRAKFAPMPKPQTR